MFLDSTVDALEGDEEEDEGDQRLSTFVGNAVGRGVYAWHCDADPSLLPWDSPWAQHHGVYYNREVRIAPVLQAPGQL